MIIRTDEFKTIASKVLSAVDSNELSIVTETLELVTIDNYLYINVTNGEYFAQIRMDLKESFDFHATVNANLFLKLISQTTTESIELTVKDTYLLMHGNGNYKLPLIFSNNELLKLPQIIINNKTSEFDIPGSILLSILQYNSKELVKGTISRPVQKLYYVDEQGAITFTSGACVNKFTLAKPVRILLNNRLVKLFKLFGEEDVHFSLGYDEINDGVIQTKVSFESATVILTAVLSCDDTLLNSVPAAAIRGRASGNYDYSVTLNKDSLLQTINRLLLFNAGYGSKETLKPYSTFEFTADQVTIYDVNKDNQEKIFYSDRCDSLVVPYSATLDLTDFKTTLENCPEQYLTISFGNHAAVLLSRGNIFNVIPEVMSVAR